MNENNENNGKKIIWVHGTKGGIGKSLMASVVVDYLIENGGSPAIVEADGSVPDVHRRFGNLVPSLLSPLNDEKSVYAMLECLENAADKKTIKTIVVNLPANAELLDNVADDVKAVTAELGYTNHTIFMISESKDSAMLAIKSLENGIVSISDSAIAVVNQHFGDDSTSFAWFSAGRQKWLDAELTDSPLPKLQERVKANEEFNTGTFTRLTTKDSPLKVVDRVVVRKWLAASHSIVADLLK